MLLEEDVFNSFILGNNSALINDDAFKTLLENAACVLCGKTETHNVSSLSSSNPKPDVIKQFNAALLTTLTQFSRHNLDGAAVRDFLSNECNYSSSRAGLISGTHERIKSDVQLRLANIGTNLPHVTDVDWKIDYIVKSSNSDQSEGPLFRIALLTETYNENSDSKEPRRIEFVCNAQELQEFVYKLKDAVRHCHRIVTEHQ